MWVLLSLRLFCLGEEPVSPQGRPIPEDRLVAAYVVQFLKHVEWPLAAVPAEGDPWIVCALGEDGALAHLKKDVQGRSVRGRPVRVVVVPRILELPPCHLLYVPEASSGRTPWVNWMTGGAPILVVGRGTHAVLQGAMIGIHRKGRFIRCTVDPGALRREGLKARVAILRYGTGS